MVAEHGCSAASFVDALVPSIMEEIVKVVKTVLQERISERIRKQIVDVFVSQVVEQVTEMPKTSNLDRTLQCTAEQIFDVPVPEMVKQSSEMPKIVSQDRMQQRTVERIVDVPVPQAVEELIEVSQVFSQDRIQHRIVEQTIPAISLDEKIIEVPMDVSKDFSQNRVQQGFRGQTAKTPDISLAEKTVEMPDTRTQDKKQLVNTHVQHVVDTVEVEKPKLVKETVQRKKPIIQEKINQVTKHVEVPQVQVMAETAEIPQAKFLDKAGDMLVGIQRHVLMAQTVQKTVEVSPLQFTDKVSDIPVEAPRQISQMVQNVQKTIETQQLQCIDKVIDVPVVSVAQAPHVQIAEKTAEIPLLQIVKKTVETPEVQMVRCTQTSESPGTAPVCRSTQAEIVEAVEIGAIPPTKFARPIFVMTPVLETPRVQFIDKVVSIPVMAQRQVPSAQKVQKIVEMPKIQCCSNRSVPLIMEQIVEAPQIIPREFILSPREGRADGNHRFAPQKRKSISECGMTEDEPSEHDVRRASASSCEVSCETRSLVQGRESRLEVDETLVRHAPDEGEGLGLLPVAPNMEAGGSHLQATTEEEQIVDWTQDLREIRRMVEFLVRRERKLDVKADVAVRRLERLEREHSQLEDEEREASLQDALADRTKVVKLVVDKWFVDKGFGFGKAPTGEVVFIHASVVRGAEVLTIGTDAWVQVMHDDARAQGGIEHVKPGGTPRGKRRKTRRGQAKRQNK